MRLVILLLAGLIGLNFATAALGWGNSGHRTVCEIALRNLTPTARAEVERLLAAHPIIPVSAPRNRTLGWACTYPDNIVENAPGRRSPEHFVNYPRSVMSVDFPLGCGAADECILTAIIRDWALLRSTALPDRYRGVALMYLGHWIGDVHQPLHASFADDRGGNSLRTTGQCPGNLHSLWDSCVLHRRAFADASDPGDDEVRALAAAWSSQVSDMDRAQWLSSAPWQWAAESYEIAIRPETGYCLIAGSSCRYSQNHLVFSAGNARTLTIDNGYVDMAMPIIQRRITQAGIRLGHVVNLSLDPAYRLAFP